MKFPAPSCWNAGSFPCLLGAILFLSSCRNLEKETGPSVAIIDRPTFALIDTTADGKISPAEMAAYKHDEGVAEVDLDSDKKISPVEWRAAKPSASVDDDTFAELDLNRDGFLTKEEAVTQIIGETAFQEAFKKIDLNSDGFLVWEEYATGEAASLEVTFFTSGILAAPTGNPE